jgi:L-ascorbate peroxidase
MAAAPGGPVVDEAYKKDVQNASQEIAQILSKEHCEPLFLRLAFHDAMTYDHSTVTGGANGSIRVERERNHAGNEYLDKALELLEPLKNKHRNLTYADLFQLAGIAAISSAGGPFISFTPGRRDSRVCPPQGRLPSLGTGASQSIADLKKCFSRMGMSTQQMVALMGAHYVGRWWQADAQGPPFLDLLYRDPKQRFSNAYFKDLLDGKMPQDTVLLEDPEVKRYVEEYANNNAKFCQDYAATHEALSLLGSKLPGAANGAVVDMA